MSKKNVNDEIYSESEKHYNSLISYFKHLVWITGGILSIIFIVVGIIFYQDRSDMRDELNDVKQFAKQAIESTKDAADNQINGIRTIAIDEARIRVERAFQEHNIKSLVDSAARDIVFKSIQNQLRNEVNKSLVKIENDLNELSKISDAAMRMRVGLRSGLIDLNNLKSTLKNDYLRKRAKTICENICSDYDRINEKGYKEVYPDTLKPAEIKEVPYGFDVIKADIPNLIKIIRTEDDLNFVAAAFIILRRKTGIQFRMFDIQQVNKWWSENRDKYVKEN